MHNHKDKPRDMARSGFNSPPSQKNRRRATHRRERMRVRAALRTAVKDHADAIDDLDVSGAAMSAKAKTDIADMVNGRFFLARTVPLVRWAEHHAEHDDALAGQSIDGLVAHFRKVLPDTASGHHAAEHIRFRLRPRREQALAERVR